MRPQPPPLERWRWGDPVEPLRQTLERGGILAIPTESSYGLAVDPENPRAVDRVAAIKGRGKPKAMPVVTATLEQLSLLGISAADPALAPFVGLWPAAISVLVPLDRSVPAAAGSGKLAVRIPAHTALRDLLRALGRPLTATSANRTGEDPILAPVDLDRLLGGTDAIVVDDGQLPGGEPSTLLEFKDGVVHLLRRGRYDLAELRAKLVATGAVVMERWD